MTKTAKQLDADIAEALQDAETRRFAEEVSRLSPREQELVLRTQEIAALGDELKSAGLHIRFPPRKIIVWGRPTYHVRDVLKKYGFRFDASTKNWIRPTDYAKKDLDYLAFYNELVRRL